MGVLQVRGRVAVEGEHPLPIEDVVLGSLGREVGVLHRTDADDPRHALSLLPLKVWILLLDSRPCPSHSLSKEVEEFDRISLATLQNLAIGIHYRAEVDVYGIVAIIHESSLPSNLEHHLEVLLLGRSDHVEEGVAPEALDSVDNASEVGRRVVIATIGLPDDHREGFALAIHPSTRVGDIGPLAALEDACILQALDHHWQEVLIPRLAHYVVVSQ